MPATPESVVRSWFDELWNRGDKTTIDRLLHADDVVHGLPTPDGRPIRGAVEFERFYQAHGDGHKSGMGLGLYISRQIVELHGGRISAEFPVDGGTRFVVSLPVE